MKQFFILILLIFINCSTFQLEKHENFSEWFFGKPGFTGMVYQKNEECLEPFINNNPCACIVGMSNRKDVIIPRYKILGNRHPFYLFFRFPEAIFNPQGGAFIPKRILPSQPTEKKDKYEFPPNFHSYSMQFRYYHCEKLEEGDLTFMYGRLWYSELGYMILDAGLIEHIVPYRIWTSNESPGSKVLETGKTWILSPIGVIFKAVILSFYVVHDVVKIPVIPVAIIYYSTNQ